MNVDEWLQVGVNGLIIGVAWWIIRAQFSRFDRKLDEFISCIHALDLKLEKCVTWEDLMKELGPVRATGLDHEKRITSVEVTCSAERSHRV